VDIEAKTVAGTSASTAQDATVSDVQLSSLNIPC
jgi:hypothetical protein